MRPRRVLPTLAVVLSLAGTPTIARAWTYGDTLTTLWRPLANLPALVRPGDTFTVWANAPASATGWTASLGYGALTVPLTPAGGGWQAAKNRWELLVTVPPGTPEEMYDLTLTSSATPLDVSRHSVKVLPAFKSSYYFAQISDTHVPDHTFSSSGGFDVDDTTGLGDFSAVIEDLNLIHPEFILHTGDLVNEGELEEHLGMYEMGRAQAMLGRLRDPVFVTSGNHDIGGWDPTPPPPGTARKNWWRHYGWPYLENPPAGDPHHSQDFTFDYGPLHVIGLEAYINNGSYDDYRTDLWGAQSFTSEQMAWLQNDIAAQPPGTRKLLFYHYDFGGTLPNGSPGSNFSQINPATLGLDGAIWGHHHGVAEGNRAARPFNLGLQSVIDRRAFRLFRVVDGVMSPGPMHRSGGLPSAPTDSLSQAWSGPNDGTRSSLTATIVNRFGESFEHARVLFNLVDHDSSFVATGGTIAQVIRQGGMANVTVDCVLPAGGTTVVSLRAEQPIGGVPPSPTGSAGLLAVGPNPFRPLEGSLAVHFALAAPARARLEVFDSGGRRVAWLANETLPAGSHVARWNGRRRDGSLAASGLYVVRLAAGPLVQTRQVALTR